MRRRCGTLELKPGDERAAGAARARQPADGRADAWGIESDAKIALTKLGILNFDAKLGILSGGQRKRVAMAAALIQPADVLILDEPTNHIDNESVAWLEGMLQKRKGALLMITHDRYFLDRVSNRTLELDQGQGVLLLEANYSRFLELKLEREEREAASESKRQNLLRNELAWMRRGAQARTTKQKARIERFESLSAQGPEQAAGKLEMSVASSRLGRRFSRSKPTQVASSGRKRYSTASATSRCRKTASASSAATACGKSTLLKLIAGKLAPDEGVRRCSARR